MIPQCDLNAARIADGYEIDEAIQRVLSSGRYVLGKEVEAFENEFAQWIGCRFAVGVGNGTDAIALALKAVGVGRGSYVAAPAHTVSATVAAIEQAGATPVLVDVDPRTMTLGLSALRMAFEAFPITTVVPVHLYGQPCDLPAISRMCKEYGATLIDDCAHAFGAEAHGHRVGSHYSMASTFSFYPTKNLGCFGDGGIVTTNDVMVAGTLRGLRNYNWAARYVSMEPGGVDSRLDELQAAVLRVRLKNLGQRQRRRAHIAAQYDSIVCQRSTISAVSEHPNIHANHLYVVRALDRAKFLAFMSERDVSTNIHYPVPVHRQPAYAGLAQVPAGCPEAERAAAEVVTLPLYPEMTDSQVDAVCAALAEWFR